MQLNHLISIRGINRLPVQMKVTKDLIQRYHSGKCSAEEQEAVEQWLDSEEAEISFPGDVNLDTLQKKGWKKLQSRYSISQPAKRSYALVWKLAACLLLLAGTSILLYRNYRSETQLRKTSVAYKEVKSAKGQKLQVKLPDGTLVWLNAESTLRFPEQFAPHNRQVSFQGEGYFSVAKDASKPFHIRTLKTTVQVLGTKFNLRAFAAENTTSVVVEEGKVRFASITGHQQAILTANMRGIFESTGSYAPVMKTTAVNAGRYIKWKNNELVIENQTMTEAMLSLERWYGLTIEINRPGLAQQRYTGSFINPSVHQVLESMGFALKFKYQQEGKLIKIY